MILVIMTHFCLLLFCEMVQFLEPASFQRHLLKTVFRLETQTQEKESFLRRQALPPIIPVFFFNRCCLLRTLIKRSVITIYKERYIPFSVQTLVFVIISLFRRIRHTDDREGHLFFPAAQTGPSEAKYASSPNSIAVICFKPIIRLTIFVVFQKYSLR